MRNIIAIFFSLFAVIATASAFKISSRIVGGKPAQLNQFPYYVYLDIRSFGFGKYFI